MQDLEWYKQLPIGHKLNDRKDSKNHYQQEFLEEICLIALRYYGYYAAIYKMEIIDAIDAIQLPHLRKNRNWLSMICVFQRGRQNA